MTSPPAEKPLRLQKYLASCGVASRRECERIIAEGRVEVDGAVAHVGQSVLPSAEMVTLDGTPISPESQVYILLNKPRGVVSTVTDTHGRTTVRHCIRPTPERLAPVGRLDRDVQGVLLLTNDGALMYRLTHPSFEIDKTYRATVRGRINDEMLHKLEVGVKLEDGKTAPAKARLVTRDRRSVVDLSVHEGRNRLVKRMFRKVGHPVLELERIGFAGLDCKDLKPGAWRHLSDKEVEELRRLAGF